MQAHSLTVVTARVYFGGPDVKEIHSVIHSGWMKDWWDPQNIPWVRDGSMHIVRSGRVVPDLFMTAQALIVNAHLAERLRTKNPNINLRPVVFEKLVDFFFEKGDLSWYERTPYVDPEVAMRALPDVPEYHRNFGTYYEIIPARQSDLPEDLVRDAARGWFDPDQPLKKRKEFVFSAELFDLYPVHWQGYTVMRTELFDVLRDAIDPDFFVYGPLQPV